MKATLIGGVVFSTTVRALEFWSPRQTPAPRHAVDALGPRPTAPPGLDRLHRRQSGGNSEVTFLVGSDETCGYVSGLSSVGYGCGAFTETCVLVPATSTIPGYVGCCDDVLRECAFVFGCMDYDQIITSSLCDAGCMADSFIAKCTASEYPFCQTISFPGSIFDYFCGPVSYSTPRPARTTYEGETDGREFVTSVFSNNILGERPTALSKTSWKTRPSSTRTNPSSSAVSKSSSSSSTSTSIRPASTPSAASEKSSTPIGAIVGGVLGGLAVLGPIALGALCILRRKPPPSADSQLAYQTDPLNELPADAGVYQPFYEELPSDDRSRELPADDPAKYSGRTQPMVQTYHTVPPHASSDQQYPGNTQPGTVHEIGE